MTTLEDHGTIYEIPRTPDPKGAKAKPLRPSYAVRGPHEIFVPLPPIPYVIEGIDLCPGAPCMIAGYGFAGKTVSAQSAALSIASTRADDRVWGCFLAAHGRVIHLDYEQGQRLTDERYQRLAYSMGLGPDDLLEPDGTERLQTVHFPPFYLDGAAGAELERLTDGRTLCIVDSLRAATPTIDENDSKIRLVLDAMTRVSERTGCCFVVIHHARKPTKDAQGGAKMAIRGSGALFDACGSVLVFEAAAKGEPVRVSHDKARASGRTAEDFEISVADEPDGMGHDRAGLIVTATAALSREDAAAAAEKARTLARSARLESEIRALFEREPTQGSVESIAKKLGRRVPNVRSILRTMPEIEASGSTRDRCHTLKR